MSSLFTWNVPVEGWACTFRGPREMTFWQSTRAPGLVASGPLARAVDFGLPEDTGDGRKRARLPRPCSRCASWGSFRRRSVPRLPLRFDRSASPARGPPSSHWSELRSASGPCIHPAANPFPRTHRPVVDTSRMPGAHTRTFRSGVPGRPAATGGEPGSQEGPLRIQPDRIVRHRAARSRCAAAEAESTSAINTPAESQMKPFIFADEMWAPIIDRASDREALRRRSTRARTVRPGRGGALSGPRSRPGPLAADATPRGSPTPQALCWSASEHLRTIRS